MKVSIYSLSGPLPLDIQQYLIAEDIYFDEDEEGCILIVENNGSIIFCETDSMCPEDATFYRSLSWIPEIIEKAYELGMEHCYSKAVDDSLIPNLHE